MKLMPEKEWERRIERLKRQTRKSNKKQLKKAIVKAVSDSIPDERFGVFLSGGVDSSLLALLAKKAKTDFVCYAVGLEGSDDLFWAEKTAKKLRLKLKTKKYSLREAESLFRETARFFKKPDVLNVGVGSVINAAAKLARKDNVKIFLGGLGAEEIFCGYQRHEKAKDKQAECWRGLKSLWKRDLKRDFAIMSALGIEVRTPFLDEGVIKTAMGIPATKKINKKHKKIVLREIAQELGLPKVVAWRQKKAAQYGSRFDWALARLAKLKGFFKADFVKSLNKSLN